MTKVAILPEPSPNGPVTFRAISGKKQSVGNTAGEALDALSETLPPEEKGTLVIVQSFRPDSFFTASQQQRLGELIGRWREARDRGETLPAAEQTELDELIESEVRAASRRAEEMLRTLRE
jgi:hypothetical protein